MGHFKDGYSALKLEPLNFGFLPQYHWGGRQNSLPMDSFLGRCDHLFAISYENLVIDQYDGAF